MLNLCKFFVKFSLRTPRAGAAPYGPSLVLLAGFGHFRLEQPYMAASESFLGLLKSSAPRLYFAQTHPYTSVSPIQLSSYPQLNLICARQN